MIQIYNEIIDLSLQLNNLIEGNKIEDYRIYLKSNNNIAIYIIADSEIASMISQSIENPNIELEYFSKSDTKDFLQQLYFKNPNKVNILDSNKSLVNLLEDKSQIDVKPVFDFPIATFYSYKGGVGRSTTLAACASYLALHYKKRIVIIDCDFEAPGFTNFFLNDPGIPFNNNGVIEYLLDREFLGKDVNVRNYVWEASKDFTGSGEIYVMPSGNLSDIESYDNDNTDRDQYLKGLARINFSEKPYITERFTDLINSINSELHPDLILLDSRTGFNDIFGLTAFHLSNIVVGFFGSNVQTIPGIHFFIDSLIRRKNLTGIIVNSIIPAANKRRWFKNFKDDVDLYINSVSGFLDQNNESEKGIINTDQINIEMFPITRQEILEALGTRDDDKLDFIDFINSKVFSDYVDLFEKINSLMNDYIKKPENVYLPAAFENIDLMENIIEDCPEIIQPLEEPSDEIMSHSQKASVVTTSIFDIKKQILTTLQDKMPELYAEHISDFGKEYSEGRYFYRKCMLDIFNLDKFIVLGNKGTGKTYIYRSLENKNIVRELKTRANKTNVDYQFIQLIFKGKYFIDTTKFDGMEVFSTEKYYERFWQVYIWNVLITELSSDLGITSELETFSINDNTETAVKFNTLIKNDQQMIKVESDLENIDVKLKNISEKHIIIIFDELDHVVKPHMWSERVAPLINLCKRFSFSRIFPKLFLRSDLFEKISNVNNIQALNNKSIKIEWDREELFAYFFKVVLSHSKDSFFYLMREYKMYPLFYVNKIIKAIDLEAKQPPTDEYILRHLTATFFGKYADVDNTPRFGESYDWFFRNLKNANDTISLRPFIDLISEAVKWALNEDKNSQPILPQFYYTHGKAREYAVERHFQDLAREKGNGDLIFIFNYLKDDANSKFKVLELQQKDFYELLDLIMKKYPNQLENKSKESLIDLLKVNGIIIDRMVRIGYNRNVQKRYQFALLYKYYLGLRNKR